MARIHPLACIDPAAEIGDDVEIGPYCIVGAQVRIGARCRLVGHVHVAGPTEIGAGTVVHPYASLGGAPQSTAYRGEPTRLVIGAGCDIREGVTMSRGTQGGGGVTRVGERGMFMAASHVGHDCRVGHDVVFANCATLGGHCDVGDHVNIGGLTAVHQFVRIGDHAMVGGASGVRADVIPFGVAFGVPARLSGVNAIGMKRRGFSDESIAGLRRAYRRIFMSAGGLDERLAAAEAEGGADAQVALLLEFIRARGKRPLCRHAKGSDD